MDNSILPIDPGISRTPWGGTRLAKLLGIPRGEGEPIGETWNISSHPKAPGKVDGIPLSDQLDGKKLPYLVKLIDTAAPLSVQVHPDDKFAQEFENTQGKTECWLILAADANAGIHLGLRPGVTRVDFEQALHKNDRIDELLNFRRVRPGDFFYIPAGTLHSIGAHIFLAEVQQNSGVTYRVWDQGRQGRQLHLDKAMRVINFDPAANADENFRMRSGLLAHFGHTHLVQHPQFSLSLYHLKKGDSLTIEPGNTERACSLLTIKGKAKLNGQVDTTPFQAYLLKGKHLAVSANEDCGFIYVC